MKLMRSAIDSEEKHPRSSWRFLRYAVPIAACLCLGAMLAQHMAAQGCAMCYQNAAASAAQSRAALRHGILILLLPAVGLFGGIFALIYLRRNAYHRDLYQETRFLDRIGFQAPPARETRAR
jgi:hypothetical protein